MAIHYDPETGEFTTVYRMMVRQEQLDRQRYLERLAAETTKDAICWRLLPEPLRKKLLKKYSGLKPLKQRRKK